MIRERLARALLDAAARMAPEVVEERFRARVSEATVKTVMALMDQQGIPHCALCASRADLMVRNGARLCAGHRKDGGDRG